MRIDLCRGDVPMAQELLNLPDIVSPADQIEADRMAERMRGISPFQPGKPDPLLKIMLNTPGPDTPALP